MSRLVAIIRTADPQLRDQSLDAAVSGLSVTQLRAEIDALESFRRSGPNLYERVRALFFLAAIYRYHLPGRLEPGARSPVPYAGHEHALARRFEEAIASFRGAEEIYGPSGRPCPLALAGAYRALGFETLADQVRRSVRSVRGNQWMFRTGHVLDYPLSIRPELCIKEDGLFPLLSESTPVRMDLTHSGWSDIFFLSMDQPEGARVINASIDLCVRDGMSAPRPPVQCFLRVLEEPALRLVSIDLGAEVELTEVREVFDFGRDHLGLLRAAVIASGLIPAGLEGSGQSLTGLLGKLLGQPGLGLELVSAVHNIPKGSRLAVSTSLLASMIAVCMRASGQIRALEGGLTEVERRVVAARAILGEWLGGSGGGWQDSGGVWPGIKLIQGAAATKEEPEFGVSRGCLLPAHEILGRDQINDLTRQRLQESLVLVHGGMAQDVGPILEMVTERYLLRSEPEWSARSEARRGLDRILGALREGDLRRLGRLLETNYREPLQTIIPWAGNDYTDQLIHRMRDRYGECFWGFWMLGGMAGGGMGFLFDPAVHAEAQETLLEAMRTVKRDLEAAVPFAMDPVVYDFAINERGTMAEFRTGPAALLPASYYSLRLPKLIRQEVRALPDAQRAELGRVAQAAVDQPAFSGIATALIEQLLPQQESTPREQQQELARLLDEYGFDRQQHEVLRADLRTGRIGLAQNALPRSVMIEDAGPADVQDTRIERPAEWIARGEEALRKGEAAVLTLAGGAGSRWTGGAGVVKAIHPFCRLAGSYRTFLDIHVAKSRRTGRSFNVTVPHLFSTSYLTHAPIARYLDKSGSSWDSAVETGLSPGRSIGLRFVPMRRDLEFIWRQAPQQALDERRQKVRDSARAAWLEWAERAGEATDYRDNLPLQCLHPVGHWYEFPNLLLNGGLAGLWKRHPQVRYLLLHNIDTLGAWLDPGLLGAHLAAGAAMSVEVLHRTAEDRGGGLARVDGRLRLVEGLAFPEERIEFELAYYNSGTMWLDLDQVLGLFGLDREGLQDPVRVRRAVRRMAARIPAYITIKDVKKRWGRGQEDIYPVAQFERIWGDMTALPEANVRYLLVSRRRGHQLKQVAQLDGWLREGSAAEIEALGAWD